MELAAFAKDFILFSPLALLLFLIPVIYIFNKHIISHSSKRQPLPPGPKPWPIIGNLLHLRNHMPHISLTNYAKTYGPLISLRLGTQTLVVGSSPAAATEIFKTHDRLLSARYVPNTSACRSSSIVWATKCTDEWKSLRALCRTELFSAKAIESQAPLREKKVKEMVEILRSREGKVVNIGEVVFTTVFNTIGNLIFSKDLIGLEDERAANGLKSLVRRMMELVTTPNIADFYPVFASLDPQSLRRKALRCVQEMFAIWGIYIKERRESYVPDSPKKDFLDVFLANGFHNDQINWLAHELFSAGTDTTTTTIEWAMAELLNNKEAMKKLKEELQSEIIKGSLYESHVSQLPYLNACVKEALRLHPPGPFLLPHRALESCEVMNYSIPKDSQVIVNVWAIGRDPSIWEDPLSFKPERFLDTNLDFKGQNFELLPFGSGRRICPGLSMASKQVALILASLVHFFDWSLPDGDDSVKLDMKEKFGITLQKEQPLLLVPTQKL